MEIIPDDQSQPGSKTMSPNDSIEEKPETTHVAVFERVGDSMKERYFFETKIAHGPGTQDISQAEGTELVVDLETILEDKRTKSRVIVVVHEGYGHVNRGRVLGTISKIYKLRSAGLSLDPMLLSHFYWDSRGSTVERCGEPPPTEFPESLPSAITFLSLDYDGQIGAEIIARNNQGNGNARMIPSLRDY